VTQDWDSEQATGTQRLGPERAAELIAPLKSEVSAIEQVFNPLERADARARRSA
jgi:hypothetical protein